MKNEGGRFARIGLVGLFLIGGSGCAAAAVGAAAGVAGTIAYSDRGVKAEVKGDPQTVAKQTEAVFKKKGIATTNTAVKNSGKEQDLQGNGPTAEVSVSIVSAGKNTSHVEVVAKQGSFKWNKDYAKEVLSDIIQST
ncbi:MAG: DUF3568 family protein [Bdellovibrionota bacterium]